MKIHMGKCVQIPDNCHFLHMAWHSFGILYTQFILRSVCVKMCVLHCVCQNLIVRVLKDFAEFEPLKVVHLVGICI